MFCYTLSPTSPAALRGDSSSGLTPERGSPLTAGARWAATPSPFPHNRAFVLPIYLTRWAGKATGLGGDPALGELGPAEGQAQHQPYPRLPTAGSGRAQHRQKDREGRGEATWDILMCYFFK